VPDSPAVDTVVEDIRMVAVPQPAVDLRATPVRAVPLAARPSPRTIAMRGKADC
jgi:hypothetical protein